jgi:hypothetical protein
MRCSCADIDAFAGLVFAQTLQASVLTRNLALTLSDAVGRCAFEARGRFTVACMGLIAAVPRSFGQYPIEEFARHANAVRPLGQHKMWWWPKWRSSSEVSGLLLHFIIRASFVSPALSVSAYGFPQPC